jgi:TP901 family phage tail tape measure protein
MAAKFDASMEMLATQAGVPQAKIAGLKSGVLALASQVGFSPDSLAESLYHVASNMSSLGATGPQMLNLVKVAAEGARVGGADLVDVTNALTSVVASGIPGAKNYAQAMGMINATVGAGDMKMQDFAEALATGVVPIVKGYGLTLKDVGAALAVYGDLNIRGAHAGTQLRLAVQAIAVPAAGAKKILADLGMTTQQMAQDQLHGGLLPALEDLSRHFKAAGISAKDEGPYITAIFGKKAGAGIALLLENMTRLQSKYPAIAAGAKDFGSAWQRTQQQTAQVFADLRAWFDALMISIGEKLLPVVKAVGTWMLNNKTAIEVTLGVLAALVGVIGTYVLIVKAAAIATEVWAVVQKALNLELDLNPVGLIILAIGALVIGLVEAYKHSALFRDIVHEAGVVAGDAFRWILHTAMEVFDWIKGHWRMLLPILFGPIGLAVDFITAHWHTISRVLGETIEWIRTHWQQTLMILLGPIGVAVVLIIRHWHDIMAGVDWLIGLIRSHWGVVYDLLIGPVEQAYHVISGIFSTIGNAISSVKNALGGVGSFFGFAHGGITGAAGGGPRGGYTMVGEYGPELVRLPYGSQVYSNAQTQGMLGGGGGGGQVQIELVATGDDLLLRWLRNAIRIRGGNVQQVLGQGST